MADAGAHGEIAVSRPTRTRAALRGLALDVALVAAIAAALTVALAAALGFAPHVVAPPPAWLPRADSPLPFLIGLYAAIAIVWFVRGRGGGVMPRPWRPADGAWIGGCIVAMVLAKVAVVGAYYALGGAREVAAAPNDTAVFALLARSPLWLLLVVAVGPAFEELLFRRTLFAPWLHTGRPWLGALLVSALFALVHAPGAAGPELGTLYFLCYAAISACLCTLYARTHSTLACVLAHVGYNTLTLGLARLAGIA